MGLGGGAGFVFYFHLFRRDRASCLALVFCRWKKNNASGFLLAWANGIEGGVLYCRENDKEERDRAKTTNEQNM